MGTEGGRTSDDLTPAGDGGATPGPPRAGLRAATVEGRLYDEGYAFDFFQAVRLLHALDPMRLPVGHDGPPEAESVRFRAHISLGFPPSAIFEVARPTAAWPIPTLTQAFLGLAGPSGVLPRHYTELLLRLEKEGKDPETPAFRAWLDLFNHRLASFFYRAWEKYRFDLAFERREYARPEPDVFTRGLLSLVGLGLPPLRHRLRVSTRDTHDAEERTLARVDDLAVLYYGGLFAHRPRNALGLESILGGYFRLPVRVRQFLGCWLRLEPENQTRLGEQGASNRLGTDAVVGERVWDRQGKFRVRAGPLRYDQFVEFLPDRAPVEARKAVFALVHLVRLYVGPDLDFDVQLILEAAEVPECQLSEGEGVGPRLGWNTWLRSLPFEQDAEDGVLEGVEVFRVAPEVTP